MPTYSEIKPGLRNVDPGAVAEIEAVNPSASARMGMGLRSGAYQMGGQVVDLSSAVAEAAGAQELAQRGYAQGKRLGLRAAELAPPDIEVNDFDSAMRYGGGLAGGAVPGVALGLGAASLTGGASIPAQVAAATAANVIPEAGDVVRRQLDDPELTQRSAGERLVRAGLAGGASALAQNIPVGGLAARLGKGGVRSAVMEHLASAPGTAAGMAAGEALKQIGANDGISDTGAIRDQAIAGGVLGAGLSAAGAVRQGLGRAADAAGSMRPPEAWQGHVDQALGAAKAAADGATDQVSGLSDFLGQSSKQRLAQVKQTYSDLMGSEDVPAALREHLGAMGEGLGDRAAQAYVWGLGKAQGAKEAASPAGDMLRGLLDFGRSKVDDTMDRVADGQELGDLEGLAKSSPDKINASFRLADEDRLAKVKQWATDLSEDAGLSPERRQALTASMQDLGDRANQATVATLKKAQTAGQTAVAQVQSLYESLKGSIEGTKTGTKKSEDFSGIRRAISEDVMPILEQRQPELLNNPDAINKLADSLRLFVEGASGGRALNEAAVGHLKNVFGEDTQRVLSGLYAKVGDAGDRAKTERYFAALNDIAENENRGAKLRNVVERSLTKEMQDTALAKDIPALIKALKAYASADSTMGMTPAQKANHDAQMKVELQRVFGPKVAEVLAAVEKDQVKGKQALDTGEGGLTEGENLADQHEARYYGGKLMDSPEAHRVKFSSESQAERLMKQAQTENPDRSVRFVPAKELPADHPARAGVADKDLEGKGLVAAEGMKQEGRLSPKELDAVKLDTTKTSHLDSPSRIDTGVRGVTLDARRLTKLMDGKLPYDASDDLSKLHRTARVFMDGIAAAQDHLGKSFEVPDSTVIDAKGTTFGEVKKLKFAPPDKKVDDANAAIKELRAKYRDISADKTMSDAARGRELSKLIKEAEKAQDQLNASKLRGEDTARELSALEAELRNAGKHALNTSGDAGVDVVTAGLGSEKDMARKRTVSDAPTKDTAKQALGSAINRLENSDVALQRKLGARARVLYDNLDKLSELDRGVLISIVKEKQVSDMADTINGLARKYKDKVDAPKPLDADAAFKTLQEHLKYLNDPPADYTTAKAKELLAKANEQLKAVEAEREKVKGKDEQRHEDLGDVRSMAREVIKKAEAVLEGDESLTRIEGTPGPKALAAKKAALTEQALSGDKDLIKTLKASDDAKGLQRAAEHLAKTAPGSEALAAVNERLGELVQNPDVAYALNTKAYSMEGVDPKTAHTAQDRADVEAHIDKVLGQSVGVEWANIMHAGEFSSRKSPNTRDVIRLSVHSLNPMSTAYHESLHGFLSQLRAAKIHGVSDVLAKAADTGFVRRQLEQLLAKEPEALKQLSDPEERAAYMYQFWAQGQLKVSGQPKTVLGKIADFLRSTLGIWSNDARALHVMDYFQSGEYAKSMADPSAVARALLEPGRSAALDKARSMTEPLARLADEIGVAGHQRLRDTGIPALREMADLMKAQTFGENQDHGFLPTARAERTRVMNDLGTALKDVGEADISAALEALQKGVQPQTLAARLAARTVRKVLDDSFAYMRKAGVQIQDLGVGKDYFPRVYDTDYISRHQAEFVTVLEKHGVANAQGTMRKIVNADGNEFQVEVDRPGMQFAKTRELAAVPDAELAPFMKKNLFEIMNSYVTQATRRAEWARRFEDDGAGITKILAQAKTEGATKEQLTTAEKYVRAVDGTLGDHLNPTSRRLMGNMIVYQNIRLLPLAIFSSVVDPVGIAVRGGTVGDAWGAFKRGVKEVRKNFNATLGKDAATELAETLGVVDNAALVHSLGSLYSQGMVGDTAKKINDTFFRFNLMEQFNTSMRVGAMEASLRFLARHADDVSPHSARWLAELGLTKDDIQKDAAGRVKLTEADGLSADQAGKMRLAVNKWVDGAVLRPDAADKPIWMNDPHWALIAHLKQFVYSFHETILKRVAHEYRHGNFAPAMAMASYVPIMIAADAAKGLIQGGGSQPEWKDDWGPGDYLWSGVQRGGLLGTGQFVADMAADVGRGGVGVGALAGPTIEQFMDAVRVLDGQAQFGGFALKSMPANALYAGVVGGEATDPKFTD